MGSEFISNSDDPDSAPPVPDPFDPAPAPEAELWFLPDPGTAQPVARAAGRDLDLRAGGRDPELRAGGRDPELRAGGRDTELRAGGRDAWIVAQAAAVVELAELAARLGALAERLRTAPPGRVRRLALAEAAALSWWAGDRIPPDRLAAAEAGHLHRPAEDDPQALARAVWAYRRLAGAGDPRADPAGFLGRAGATPPPACPPELHPVVGAAWLMAHRPVPTPALAIEAAVLAARLGAAPFLPLARAGAAALSAAGAPAARLPRWIDGAVSATRSTLRMLDRLAAWEDRAARATADLSGRTPPRLIAALADHPVLAAPVAEAATGASRAAVQRNLDRLAARGLVREVTGQGRYRLWAAAL